MVRAEEDADQDGQVDKWETFAEGALATVAFNEDGDGRPDRRLSYGADGALRLIESEPDSSGAFTRAVRVA